LVPLLASPFMIACFSTNVCVIPVVEFVVVVNVLGSITSPVVWFVMKLVSIVVTGVYANGSKP
jgi:hypothetical protein